MERALVVVSIFLCHLFCRGGFLFSLLPSLLFDFLFVEGVGIAAFSDILYMPRLLWVSVFL